MHAALKRIQTNDKEPTPSAGNENMKAMRQIRTIHLVITGLLLAFLSACGGGGGGSDPGFIGGGIDDPGGGGGGGGSASVTIELTDTAGNPTSTVSASSPGIVTVTSSLGADQLVNVTTTLGTISPASGLTNADGIAQFVLEAGEDAGAGTVTATVEGESASVNFEVDSPTAGNNVLNLTLTDLSGSPTTNITDISPGTLTVIATDTFGQPVANQIVSATATIGAITPSSGTALTDLSGVATFTLSSGGSLGAGTVTATLGTVSSSLNYQIGEANLRLGRFSGGTFIEGEVAASVTTLPAAGSTPLSVSVVEADDSLVTTVVPVQFTSGCAGLTPPLAELAATVNTINGVATATYTASGCTGTDTVTAAIVQGNTQTANVTLTIATADVNSVAFIDAVPQTIALQGTGGAGRSETSSVSFQVLDTTGAPASGIDVAFSLSTTIGGLSLTNDQATTNEDGIVNAIVQAGNVSTSVRVTATINVGGQQLSTVSDRLIVSTGLPDQNSISVGPGLKNPGGGNVDGITTSVTIRMADKFNNPVPDGTVAFFTTEYGSIGDSCELIGGACTVTWTSQEPRLPLIYNSEVDSPPDVAFVSTIFNRTCPSTGEIGFPCPDLLGPIYGRRSTVSVIAVGEESFIDTNGNGVYDVGEPFEDLPEAWLNKNENAIFDNTEPLCTIDSTTEAGRRCAEGQEEIFFDFNENGIYDQANGLYNGTLCPQALADAGQCSRELVHVRQDFVIVMSGVQGIAVFENGVTLTTGGITVGPGTGNRGFVVYAADRYNNLPSAGATISVTGEGCTILGGDATVPDTNGAGAYPVGFTVVNEPDNTTDVNGSITVTISGSVGSPDDELLLTCVDQAG